MDTDTDTRRGAPALTKRQSLLQDELNAMALTTGYALPAAVVHVATNATEPRPFAPAWFNHKTADVTIHLDKSGLAEPFDERDRAVAAGLTYHELAHSAWSRWMMGLPRGLDRVVRDVIVVFEEMRIEQRAVNSLPHRVRGPIRAALPLAAGNLKENPPTTRYDAARGWAVVYGRSITTVIDPEDVEWVDSIARTVLGDDDVDYLTDILQEAIEADQDFAGHHERMIALAERWIDVVGRPESTPGGGCEHGTPTDSDGETVETEADDAEAEADDTQEDGDEADADSADGEPEDDDEGTETKGAAGAEDSVDPDDAPTESPDLLSEDEAEMIEEAVTQTIEEVAEEWDAARTRGADPQEMAAKVFGNNSMQGLTVRKPSKKAHQEVAATARVLEALAVPAVTKRAVAKAAPPGKLKTRAALQGSVERSQGRMVTAKPWKSTKRTHDSVRPVVLGVATDTSGSMAWAEDLVAEFAYIWTNAGSRIGARTAAVTFGDSVKRIARPGELMSGPVVKAARDSSERCDDGLAALDGVLHFSTADNKAKVVIIVSDGHFVRAGETAKVLDRLAKFAAAGTKIIWVTPSSGFGSITVRDGLKPMGGVVVNLSDYGWRSWGDDEAALLPIVQKAVFTELRKMV